MPRKLRRINNCLDEMSPQRHLSLGRANVSQVARHTEEGPGPKTSHDLFHERRLCRMSEWQSKEEKGTLRKGPRLGQAEVRTRGM